MAELRSGPRRGAHFDPTHHQEERARMTLLQDRIAVAGAGAARSVHTRRARHRTERGRQSEARAQQLRSPARRVANRTDAAIGPGG